MNSIALYILDLVLIVAGTLFVRFGGAEYLKTLLKEKLVHILVYSVEQKITGSKLGEEKKAEVILQLNKLHIKVDTLVDAMIESAVGEINIITKKSISNVVK